MKELYIKKDAEKSYSECFIDLFKNIQNFENIKINAIMYQSKETETEGGGEKFYTVFEKGLWGNFFNKKNFINEVNLKNFDMVEWFIRPSSELYNNIYVEFNNVKYIIRVTPSNPNQICFDSLSREKRKELLPRLSHYLFLEIFSEKEGMKSIYPI